MTSAYGRIRPPHDCGRSFGTRTTTGSSNDANEQCINFKRKKSNSPGSVTRSRFFMATIAPVALRTIRSTYRIPVRAKDKIRYFFLFLFFFFKKYKPSNDFELKFDSFLVIFVDCRVFSCAAICFRFSRQKSNQLVLLLFVAVIIVGAVGLY
jgi:hypothetical protein